MLKSNYISAFLQSHLSGYEDLFTKRNNLKLLKAMTKTMGTTHENMFTVKVN